MELYGGFKGMVPFHIMIVAEIDLQAMYVGFKQNIILWLNSCSLFIYFYIDTHCCNMFFSPVSYYFIILNVLMMLTGKCDIEVFL